MYGREEEVGVVCLIDPADGERGRSGFLSGRRVSEPNGRAPGPSRCCTFLRSDEAGSDSDAAAAQQQLASISDLPENPTTRQVIRLRQRFRTQPSREDPTGSIRLVWLSDEGSEGSESDDPYSEPLPAKEVSLKRFVTTGNTSESEQEEGEEGSEGEVVVE